MNDESRIKTKESEEERNGSAELELIEEELRSAEENTEVFLRMQSRVSSVPLPMDAFLMPIPHWPSCMVMSHRKN